MTKKTRKILFVISIFFFALLSTAAVLYSLGFKYDFIDNQLVKTGSFRVATNLSNAEVYINSELEGKTSFITGNFSKGRFLPRTYNVRIEKDGYQTWEKNVDIESGLFTDFPVIVLLPDEFEIFNIASSAFSEPFFSFDKKLRRAYLEKGSLRSQTFADRTQNYADNKRSVEIINLENRQTENVIEIPADILRLNPVTVDGNFYYISQNRLTRFNTETEDSEVLEEAVNSFYVSEEDIYFIKFSDRSLYVLNINSLNVEEITESLPIDTDLIFNAEKINNNHYILLSFLNSANKLFVFGDTETEEIVRNVRNFKISPDRQKMAYFNRNEIWVMWLDDTSSQPIKVLGEKELITRYSQEIENVDWYKDSEHLFVQVGDSLSFIEIDSRGKKRNQFDVIFFNGQFQYDGINDKIWIFEGSELGSMEIE